MRLFGNRIRRAWLVLRKRSVDFPEGAVLLAVWDELSERCREDLIHARPGAIIRCTAEEFERLHAIYPFSSADLRVARDRQVAEDHIASTSASHS